MRPTVRQVVPVLIVAMVLVTPVLVSAASGRPPASPPSVIALTQPPAGAELTADARPTFAWEATPGGRFRVEFSAGNAPFLAVLTSGHRTTPGDRFKPSTQQWKSIVGLAASTGTSTVYWRVVALGMTEAQVAAAPISFFAVK